MFFMLADPLREQVGGGWALEIDTFLGPDMATSELGPRNRDFLGPEMATSEASAIWVQKSRVSRAQPLPLAQVMDLPASTT
jgi:hypothetical protein